MRRIALLVAVSCCAACVTTVELSPAIGPARAAPEKSSEAAGVVCSPGLLAHVERAHFYAFELGEPLCGALTKSVEGTYRSAQRVAEPYKGQFNRVIRFYLASSALGVRHMPDGSVRASYSIGVAVETCGRDLKPTTRKLVTGNGVVTRADASAAQIVKEAADAALQQVADSSARLLLAGIDGPRVRTSTAESPPETAPAAPER